eukprot:scaffold2858_cov659-Pavlova_lutheri.AAC.74
MLPRLRSFNAGVPLSSIRCGGKLFSIAKKPHVRRLCGIRSPPPSPLAAALCSSHHEIVRESEGIP